MAFVYSCAQINLPLKREIQTKTTLSYHFSPIRLAKVQKFYKPFVASAWGKRHIAGQSQSQNGSGNMEYIETKNGIIRNQLVLSRM